MHIASGFFMFIGFVLNFFFKISIVLISGMYMLDVDPIFFFHFLRNDIFSKFKRIDPMNMLLMVTFFLWKNYLFVPHYRFVDTFDETVVFTNL